MNAAGRGVLLAGKEREDEVVFLCLGRAGEPFLARGHGGEYSDAGIRDGSMIRLVPKEAAAASAPCLPCKTELGHHHDFGQEAARRGEARTRVVVFLTVVMMLAEVSGGLLFGSMALLADGIHMASHSVALGISLWAYAYARRHAHDERFAFGTGKVHSLAGFAGAVLLGLFALMMAVESVERFLNPVSVSFTQAIIIAVVGLAVNAVSAFLLDEDEEEGHHHDHNARSAYLHVLADALTSVLAIAALLFGRLLGWWFLDPAMGIVGAVLVTRWSLGLLRETSAVLLDHQESDGIRGVLRQAVERRPEDRIADLHVWRVAPEGYAAVLSIVSKSPLSPGDYRRLVPDGLPLMHINIEVHPCRHGTDPDG